MGHVLALAASPTEAVFAASMATSAAAGWQAAGRLTLWNMRTFLKVFPWGQMALTKQSCPRTRAVCWRAASHTEFTCLWWLQWHCALQFRKKPCV